VLDTADVLEERVDDEQDNETKERHHPDHRAETARVTVAVVATAVFVPALVRDAAEHYHRKQLQRQQRQLPHGMCGVLTKPRIISGLIILYRLVVCSDVTVGVIVLKSDGLFFTHCLTDYRHHSYPLLLSR